MRLPSLLRTRVARRILLLFLVCAVLPVVSFALIGYAEVAGRLEAEARTRLRDGSKTAGQVLFTRLQTLSSRLVMAGVARGWRADSTLAVFRSIQLEHADGSVQVLSGDRDALPLLNARQRVRLANGGTVLVVRGATTGPSAVHLVTEIPGRDGRERLWGVAAFDALVGQEEQLNPALPGTTLCVLDATGTPLSCAEPEPAAAARSQDPGSAEQMEWSRGDTTFLMGRWQLFLGNEFVAPSWTVALSMPRAAVFAPLAQFRRVALLGVALAGLLVFFLSHAQLRRRMTPLAELESGVRRIREGDFATPVTIRSADEFETLAESFNGMARDLRRQFSTLEALHAVDLAALEVHSAEDIAAAALAAAPDLLESDLVALAYADDEHPGRWIVAAQERSGGRRTRSIIWPHETELAELEQVTDYLRLKGTQPGRSGLTLSILGVNGERLVVPVRHAGRVRAVLVAGRRVAAPYGEAAVALARQLADQLAVGLSNVALVGELSALSEGSMLALARTIDANSPWTAGHSERVTRGAQEIGRKLGLDSQRLDRLRRGGLLHDIGKIGIPATILDKPGALTDEERAIIQAHPAIGAEIIRPIAAFQDIIPLVQSHHELLDGTGYPEGLSGDAIPPLVRILTVADIFDALVSDRPYRPGLSLTEALRILQDGAGRRFDAEAVTALAAVLEGGWAPIFTERRPVPAQARNATHPLELVT